MSRSFILLTSSGAVLLLGLIVLTVFERGLTRGSVAKGPLAMPVIAELRPFAVTNQTGVPIEGATLLGNPWAANLIFTRCPGPCAQLSGVMRSIRAGLPTSSRARLISLTSDPEHDVPPVLARYAERFGGEAGKWDFVTGTTAEVRRLATEELRLVLKEKSEDERESADDLFLHSTLIVLVDKRGRLRVAVEGLEPGAAGRVVELLGVLEREE